MKRLVVLILLAMNAEAGINDPWYLAYRVQNGTLIQYKGPYRTKVECMSNRFQIPIGAEFLGCYQ